MNLEGKTFYIGTSGWTYTHWKEVFIFFNNDLNSYAPQNAAALARLLV